MFRHAYFYKGESNKNFIKKYKRKNAFTAKNEYNISSS